MQQEETSIFPEVAVTYATFGQRFGALLIDYIILLIPGIILSFIVGNDTIVGDLYKYREIRVAATYHDLISTIMSWLYFAGMEASRAQATVGKQALGIKVTTLNGERITFGRATGRYFSKFISGIILLFGYFMVLWDPKNQGLHDRIAGTLVLKKVALYRPEM
jgi:uncharacterized RDD family membrane protein YckC